MAIVLGRRSQRQRLQRYASLVANDGWLTRIYLCVLLIRGNDEPFNRLASNESIDNLRDVGDRDAPVKKVIGFD